MSGRAPASAAELKEAASARTSARHRQALSEWLDDLIVEADPAKVPARAIIRILDAMRGGREAIAAAIADADDLSTGDRRMVFEALGALPRHHLHEIGQARQEAIGEWTRRELALAEQARRPPS